MTSNKTYNELKDFLQVEDDHHILRSEDKKPPKGFEKFFKKKEERDAEKASKSKGKSFI